MEPTNRILLIDDNRDWLEVLSEYLRREGFQIIYGGLKADFAEDLHAHDFDVRIYVLRGNISVTRDGNSVAFQAGDHCEIPADCQHTTKVGADGVAYIVGRADRRASN